MGHIKPENAVIHRVRKNPNSFPASVNPSVAEYLYRLVRKTRPALVFEIGCCVGFSTLHIAKALKENGIGRLVSFDLNTSVASKNIKEARLSDYVEFLQGNSSVISKQYLLDHNDEEIDLAFIDGDHTTRGCVRDFNALHSHIRKGGYIIFHDIYPEMCGWQGPRLVLDYLKTAETFVAHYDVVERVDLDDFGVGICRMVSPGKNPLLVIPLLKRMSLCLKTSKVSSWLELIIFNAHYQQYLEGRASNSCTILFKMINILRGIVSRGVYGSRELKTFCPKGRLLPDSIDFNEGDSPLLLDGWYDIEGDHRFKYRWSEPEFSILLPQGTRSIEMFAMIHTTPHLSEHEHAIMDVIIGQEKVVSITFYKSEWRRYSISLTRPITKRTRCRFVLNRYYCPREEEKSRDVRNLGLAINKIYFVG